MVSSPPLINDESPVKILRSDKDSEVALTDAQSYESTQSKEIIQQIDEVIPESTALTGVGIITEYEKGNEIIIDEAFRDKYAAVSTTKFALLVSGEGDNMQVTVQSQFLVSVIMRILPRTNLMGLRKQHDSISFVQPFSPLYWFYDKILETAGDPGSLKWDDFRDLDILRRWYEKNLLAQHVDIRNTINSGYVTSDLMWALYQPNDTVYIRDVFQKPQLRIISLTDYVEFRSDFNGSYSRYRRAIRLTLLRQDWDSSAQVFKTAAEERIVHFFTGSRRITELDVLPLRYLSEGRHELLASLEARGRRWKSLVTKPSYMVHTGPAIQLNVINSTTRKHVSIHYVANGPEG